MGSLSNWAYLTAVLCGNAVVLVMLVKTFRKVIQYQKEMYREVDRIRAIPSSKEIRQKWDELQKRVNELKERASRENWPKLDHKLHTGPVREYVHYNKETGHDTHASYQLSCDRYIFPIEGEYAVRLYARPGEAVYGPIEVTRVGEPKK